MGENNLGLYLSIRRKNQAFKDNSRHINIRQAVVLVQMQLLLAAGKHKTLFRGKVILCNTLTLALTHPV